MWDWDLNLGRKELGIEPSCVRSPWQGSKEPRYVVDAVQDWICNSEIQMIQPTSGL